MQAHKNADPGISRGQHFYLPLYYLPLYYLSFTIRRAAHLEHSTTH